MTKDDIIKLARQAGWRESFTPPVALYRFAELVAAAEREACAKVCEDDFGNGALNLADAIRARGNT